MRKPATAFVFTTAVVATTVCVALPASAAVNPTPQVCHSTPVKAYEVISRLADSLDAENNQPIGTLNNSNSSRTTTKSLEVSGTTSETASKTGGADVGVDLDIVKFGVNGSLEKSATVAWSGSSSVSATMTLRPHTSGRLQSGTFRVGSTGTCTVIDSTCNTTQTTIKAYTPYEWGFVASGG